MPKKEPVSIEEIETVENTIKGNIAGAGSNVTDTAKRIAEKYGHPVDMASFSRQIREGTIPFWRVLRIADVLGYEIVWKRKGE
jgi:uncharacterized protein (UPF0248 family)